MWYSDAEQEDNPDLEVGTNSCSLNEARDNYASLGVADPHFRGRGRKPKRDEA
jgi:hypothetical protein